MFERFTKEQENSFWQYEDFFRYYGYQIVAEPISGMEDIFIQDLEDAVCKMKFSIENIKRLYKVRDHSKRMLKILHSSYPEPSFNVKVS